MKKRGQKSQLRLLERLLLTFTYLRHNPTFARLGSEFGISESYANKIYHQILDVLIKVLPMKSRKHLLDGDLETIAIDVTEQPIERPTKRQCLYYSGKQKLHTIKKSSWLSAWQRWKFCRLSAAKAKFMITEFSKRVVWQLHLK